MALQALALDLLLSPLHGQVVEVAQAHAVFLEPHVMHLEGACNRLDSPCLVLSGLQPLALGLGNALGGDDAVGGDEAARGGREAPSCPHGVIHVLTGADAGPIIAKWPANSPPNMVTVRLKAGMAWSVSSMDWMTH